MAYTSLGSSCHNAYTRFQLLLAHACIHFTGVRIEANCNGNACIQFQQLKSGVRIVTGRTQTGVPLLEFTASEIITSCLCYSPGVTVTSQHITCHDRMQAAAKQWSSKTQNIMGSMNWSLVIMKNRKSIFGNLTSVFQGHSEIISLDRKWRGERPWVTAYESMVQDRHFSCFVLWHMSLQCFQKSFPKWTVAMNCCFTLCQFPVKLPWRS